MPRIRISILLIYSLMRVGRSSEISVPVLFSDSSIDIPSLVDEVIQSPRTRPSHNPKVENHRFLSDLPKCLSPNSSSFQNYFLNNENDRPILSRSIHRNNFANWGPRHIIRQKFGSERPTSHSEGNQKFKNNLQSRPIGAHQLSGSDKFHPDSGSRNEHPLPSFVTKEENIPTRDNTDYQSDEIKSNQPLNLAALLAGAGTIGIRHKVEMPESTTESEFYDALYDEFFDMYYDPDKSTGLNSSLNHDTQEQVGTIKPTTPNIVLPTKRVKNISLTTRMSTSDKTTKQTQHSPLLTTTQPVTTVKLDSQPTRSVVQKSSSSRSISLSEILQELDMNLPQFLKSLSRHGKSLKQFTDEIQENNLTKYQFSRAKGNVDKLFEMLAAKNTTPTPIISTSKKPLVTPEKISTTERITTTEKTTLIKIENTTEKTNTTEKVEKDNVNEFVKPLNSKRPLAFGSRPGSILLKKLNSTDENNVRSDTKSEFISVETTQLAKPARPYRKDRNPYRLSSYHHDRSGRINSRKGSTQRPTLRPPYIPRPPKSPNANDDPSISFNEEPSIMFGKSVVVDKVSESKKKQPLTIQQRNTYKIDKLNLNRNDMNVAINSAIMAASILGGVALIVFIAIFLVVKHRSHTHKYRRRNPLAVPSDSSSSSSPSLPPIYSTRSCLTKELYKTSGFWNTLKKRFDPYAITTVQSPSIKDPYFYSEN